MLRLVFCVIFTRPQPDVSVCFCGNVEEKTVALVITSRPVLEVNGFSSRWLPQLPGLKTVELPTLLCSVASSVVSRRHAR